MQEILFISNKFLGSVISGSVICLSLCHSCALYLNRSTDLDAIR